MPYLGSMFLLLRFFDLNCCMIVSYSEIPLLVFWMTWGIFSFLLLTSFSFGYNVWLILVLFIIMGFSFYCFDIFTDFGRGLATLQLFRMIQTLFVWFVISEISLFGSVFWVCFSCNLLLNEFDSFYLLPMGYSAAYKISIVTHIYFLDVVSIIINTFLLFVSGLCVNMVLFSVTLRFYELTIWYLLISIYFGLLFLGNQFYEFNLISTTFSVNCYCSSFLLLDSVHFTHVFIGMLLLTLVLFRVINMLMSSSFTLILYIAGFYWHFVDVVWFILVRYVYLSM